MKVLELFAGTRSIGKAFEAKGHEVFSVEWNKDFENINLYKDINAVTADEILQNFGRPDVIWASPDCSTFSVAAISKHRRKNKETGNLDPITEYAKFCDEVDIHVLQLIEELNPTFYFIENPRGGMRKMSWMQGIPRYTVTYCQYGERRMKPTDIWTNHPNPQFKPPCKNGDKCHESAPRGSQTGTQALKNAKDKGIIPEALCRHIVDICEKYIKEREETKMELKLKEITFPEVIEFNYEELKQEITERVATYKNLVYTDDQIKDAKKDVATLRKFTKALSDERIRVKKDLLKPYEDFEAKVKELTAIVDESIKNIDGQVKGYEDQKKADKKAEIENMWSSTTIQLPIPLTLEQIFNEKWLNASVSQKQIWDEIDARIKQIETDLQTLQNLPDFSFEAIEVYKTSLDINQAIQEGKRLSEIQKKKAEQEALPQAPLPQEEPKLETPKAPDTPKNWVSFSAYINVEDAVALREFFKSRNIQYKAI